MKPAGERASGAYSAGHPFFGNQWSAAAQSGATPAQLAALATAMANPGSHAKGGGGGSKSGKGGKSGGGASAKKAATANKTAAKKAATAQKTAAAKQQATANKAARALATMKKAAGTAQQKAAQARQAASTAKTPSAKATFTARAQAYEAAAVKLETSIAAASGHRHAGPGHDPVTTGHVKAHPARARVVHKKQFGVDADHLEGRIRQSMLGLFDHQEKRTLSALGGGRGRRIRRMAGRRADDTGQPPQQPPQQPSDIPDAAAIFDLADWVAKTAAAAQPALDLAGDTAAQRVDSMLGLTERGSLDTVHQALAGRANRLAGQVTDTTFAQIQQALSDGIAEGDSTAQLADRVRHVFQVARSRAELIARTEAIGALNEAAHTYASNLPAGTVGRKEWLAVHDQRTRMTHRTADGQQVPLSMPFIVGGTLMMHPGDPTAPPSEVCNCRCSTLYLPGPALHTADAGGINTIGEAA